jgi:hypothetical protein
VTIGSACTVTGSTVYTGTTVIGSPFFSADRTGISYDDNCRDLDGIVPGDYAVDIQYTTNSITFATKDVGDDKDVVRTVVIADGQNYSLTTTTATFNSAAGVTPAPLTVSGAVVAPKVYDGTTTANWTSGPRALVGVLAGDTLTLVDGAATFGTPNVAVSGGVAATVTTPFGFTGTGASNYTITQPALANAVISPVTLEVALKSDCNSRTKFELQKVVDSSNALGTGNLDSFLSCLKLMGVIGSEDVQLNNGSVTGTYGSAAEGETNVTFQGFALRATAVEDNYSRGTSFNGSLIVAGKILPAGETPVTPDEPGDVPALFCDPGFTDVEGVCIPNAGVPTNPGYHAERDLHAYDADSLVCVELAAGDCGGNNDGSTGFVPGRIHLPTGHAIPLVVHEVETNKEVEAGYTFVSTTDLSQLGDLDGKTRDEIDVIDNVANTVRFTHASPHSVTASHPATNFGDVNFDFWVYPAAVTAPTSAETGVSVTLLLELTLILLLAGAGVTSAQRAQGRHKRFRRLH